MLYELGYKPLEVAAVTLSQFQLIATGYQLKEEKEWNRTRHIMYSVINFAGFGAKEALPPEQIISLQCDTENQKKPIRTMYQVMQLFKEFQ